MKVCLICNEYPPAKHGGIGPVTLQLAEGFVRAGHIVHVVGLYDVNEATVEELAGVRVHRLTKVGQNVRGELRSRLKMTTYIERLHRDIRFGIIEAPEWRGDTAWLRVDSPVVLRLHTSHTVDRLVTGQSRPSRFIRFFEDMALRRANRICAVSADIAQKTAVAFPCFRKRMEQEEIPVILNAIQLNSFHPDLEVRDAGLLVFAGSLKLRKGVENLLKAFELVLRQAECRLALAGSDTRTRNGGSYIDDCLRQISVEARHRVEVLGRRTRKEIAQLFSRAAVAVLPSLQEACPMVVMEAMACGAPTIFGACGPHAEIIDDGIDGLTCDPRSPNDIADKILLLLEHPDKAKKLGAAARLKAEEKFTEERFLKQSHDFYTETIALYRQHKGVD